MYNCIVYLYQREPLLHGMVWLCGYCKNLLFLPLKFISTTFGPLNVIPTFIHLKLLMPIYFPPTCENCKDLMFLNISSMVGVPFHHGPMWRYGKNLVHYHLRPHHIMVGSLYGILVWMLFHLFLSRGKRRGRR